jgi:CAAX protease family protein
VAFGPPTTAPAGWYPDPQDSGAVRYFDGRRWTEHRAAAGPRRATGTAHPALPIVVAFGALVVLAASLIANRALIESLDDDWNIFALMAISAIVGYGPSVAWCVFASRRWGTGQPLRDFGVSFRWVDLGWGPIIWLATTLTTGVVVQLVRALDVPYRSNLDTGTGSRDRTAIAAFAIAAVVVAPFVEEVIFRGMMLRGLRSRLPAAVAIAVQGGLFGLAHVQPTFGRENIGLVIALAVVGTGFGIGCYLVRRIGPTIIAHALFNGAAVIYLLVER